MVTATIATRPDRDTERALFIEFGHGRVDFPGISLEELAGGERDLVLLALPVVDAEIEAVGELEHPTISTTADEMARVRPDLLTGELKPVKPKLRTDL